VAAATAASRKARLHDVVVLRDGAFAGISTLR
jgi:hypothetical protein